MNNISTHVPPGFRFYPTDEELVDYYLRRKVNARRIDLDVIKEVDLYKIEPWDLQEICRMGNEEQSEWYFFSHKDKKYPTGTRTNRATTAGFWKATGRDKPIYSKHELIGMRKTLVFYKGRAPNGQKSDWIMHEYRLETDENGPPQEEGWVVCRVFKKKTTTMRMNTSEHGSPCWFEDQVSFTPDMDSPTQRASQSSHLLNHSLPYTHKNELLDHDYHLPFHIPQEPRLIHQLPFLENTSKLLLPSPHGTSNCNNAIVPYIVDINQGSATMPPQFHDNNHQNVAVDLTRSNMDANLDDDQVTDWRVLDKFVASQLSQEVVSNKENNNNTNYSSSIVAPDAFVAELSENISKKEDPKPDDASTSTTSSSQIDVWKHS